MLCDLESAKGDITLLPSFKCKNWSPIPYRKSSRNITSRLKKKKRKIKICPTKRKLPLYIDRKQSYGIIDLWILKLKGSFGVSLAFCIIQGFSSCL